MAKVLANDVEPVIKVGPWGGGHGVENWSFQIPTGWDIKAITIATEVVVDSLVFTIQDASGAQQFLKYGGPGGNPSQVEFASDEYLTSIDGAHGAWNGAVYITSLTFITNSGKYGPYGYDNDVPSEGLTGVAKFSVPLKDDKVAGFYGYVENYIALIGFYAKPVDAGGVISAGPWGRETPASSGRFIANVKKITVRYDVVIESLTFTVQDDSGQEEDITFGGNGGNPSTVEFASGEYITSIFGAHGYWIAQAAVYVTAIAFTTNLGKTYGPFGHEVDQPGITVDTVQFSSPPLENAEIAGFFSSYDAYIENIGIYIIPVSSTSA